MGYSSIAFIFFFLPFAAVSYAVLWKLFKNSTLQNVWLIVLSLGFYRWGLDGTDGFRILLLVIGVNYLVSRLLRHTFARWTVFVGVAFNVILLSWYKYPDQLAAYFRGGNIDDLIFPLGLSFIVFHAISYLVDTYRARPAVQNEWLEFVDFCTYILFFPKLLQGPIVPFPEMKERLRVRTHSLDMVTCGLERFLIGLGKKVLIADEISVILIDIYSASAIDPPTAWLVVLLFGLQLYFDFSGYSDMAIGLAAGFGFKFAENFNFPYISRSITEFWRRWHISLGAWFRNYVYIPLGGNRRGNVYVNLLIVFLLTGIWHGDTVVYLLWGLMHGAFVLLERTPVYRKLPWQSKPFRAAGLLYTNAVVFLGWTCFRLETFDELKAYGKLLLGDAPASVPFDWRFYTDAKVLALIGVSVLGIALLSRPAAAETLQKVRNRPAGRTIWYVLLLCVFVLCFLSIVTNSYAPFMYFQY